MLLVLAALAYVWLAPSGFKQAPDIALTTLDGRTLRLAELRGKPLLVTFWATTCPTCMKEMPHLTELHRELAPRGFQIVGIAMDYDPIADVRALVSRRQVPYLIAHDSQARAAQAFGNVRLTPTSFLIAPDGRIVQEKIGEMDMTALRAQVLGLL